MFGIVRPNTALARRGGNDPRTLQTWDPWAEIARTRQEMDDVMSRFLGYTPLSRMVGEAGAYQIPIELHESTEQFTLRAYLPGIPREDVNIEVLGQHVAVWGERRAESPAEGTKVHFSSAPYGRFRFEYELPVEIRAEEVKASFKDGVLEVALPKVQVSRPAPVKVQIEG